MPREEEARNRREVACLLAYYILFLDTYLYCHLRYPIPISFVKRRSS